MMYISVEDFYEKTSACRRLSRQEEIQCAKGMKEKDSFAREQLIQSYLPMVAGHIRRTAPHLQTIGLIYYCQKALEQAVDSFDFLQESETFTHRLSWALRQAVTRYIADR